MQETFLLKVHISKSSEIWQTAIQFPSNGKLRKENWSLQTTIQFLKSYAKDISAKTHNIKIEFCKVQLNWKGEKRKKCKKHFCCNSKHRIGLIDLISTI